MTGGSGAAVRALLLFPAFLALILSFPRVFDPRTRASDPSGRSTLLSFQYQGGDARTV